MSLFNGLADTDTILAGAYSTVCGAFLRQTPLDSRERKRHPGLLVCEGRHTRRAGSKLFKLHVPILWGHDEVVL
jgi:hypothetical protein